MPKASDYKKNRRALARDFNALLKDSQSLLDALGDDLDDSAKSARTRLEKSLDALNDQVEDMEERVLDGVRQTDQLVREYPYHTAGLCLGLGMLMGMIFSSRR